MSCVCRKNTRQTRESQLQGAVVQPVHSAGRLEQSIRDFRKHFQTNTFWSTPFVPWTQDYQETIWILAQKYSCQIFQGNWFSWFLCLSSPIVQFDAISSETQKFAVGILFILNMFQVFLKAILMGFVCLLWHQKAVFFQWDSAGSQLIMFGEFAGLPTFAKTTISIWIFVSEQIPFLASIFTFWKLSRTVWAVRRGLGFRHATTHEIDFGYLTHGFTCWVGTKPFAVPMQVYNFLFNLCCLPSPGKTHN